MLRFVCVVLSLGCVSAASASTLEILGTSSTIERNVNVATSPVANTTGDTVATGIRVSDSAREFLAWCLDLAAPVFVGQSYDYETTSLPFSNSFVEPGAVVRIQAVFDANFRSVDINDDVEAPAFQLALWETVYDTGFDLQSGAFTGGGTDGNGGLDSFGLIATTAQSYLDNARRYTGPQNYRLTFLESQEATRSQNLVSALPVPLPAPALFMIAAIGALAGWRRLSGAMA